MEDEGCIGGCIGELNLFDIAALDKDEENEWQEVVRRRLTYEQFTVTESRPDTRARHQHDGWEWHDQGQARARQDRLEVADTREPLASVSKIVKKGQLGGAWERSELHRERADGQADRAHGAERDVPPRR